MPWAASLRGKRVHGALKWLRVLFVLGVVAYLIVRLSAIGWADVWTSLPRTPWFYVLFLVMFFALPVSELAIYWLIWGTSVLRSFPVFVRKRAYNSAIIGYSGELYLYLWAKQHVGLQGGKIFSAIKDNNVLSTIASTSVTVLMLLALVLTGQVNAVIDADSGLMSYIAVATIIGALLVTVAILFRRRIISLTADRALAVLAIHVIRMLAVLGLQAAQWSVVLTHVPFRTWLVFLTVQMVLTRIPFLPNKDLIFLGVGMGLLSVVDASAAATAGMLLAGGALTQGANAAVFALTSFGAPVPQSHRQTRVRRGQPAISEKYLPRKLRGLVRLPPR
jgi:hypothetical protein